MTTHKRASSSDHYRPRSILERLGAAAGRLVGQHVIRAPLRAVYTRMLLLGTGGRGLRCELPGGEVIRLLPEFRFASWNPIEYAAFRAHLRAGDIALDVGANVGAYALLFGQWVGPHGRVHAFEPAAGARRGLTKHVQLNGLQDVVAVHADAVTGSVGVASFSGTDASGSNRVITHGTSTVHVPCVTLDHFCAAHGLTPSLVKIDVEGVELDVLRGARTLLREQRGRIAIFVELHPDIWPSLGVSRADIEAELERQGWRAEAIGGEGDPWTTNGLCVRLVPR